MLTLLMGSVTVTRNPELCWNGRWTFEA